MAGSPALFIDGKFISCPRPKSEIFSFSQGLRSGHPLADHEPGLRFFVIFGARRSSLPSEIRISNIIQSLDPTSNLGTAGDRGHCERVGTMPAAGTTSRT